MSLTDGWTKNKGDEFLYRRVLERKWIAPRQNVAYNATVSVADYVVVVYCGNVAFKVVA